MIKLSSKTISATSLSHLKSIQDSINAESSFKGKVVRANTKWDSKRSTIGGKAAFKEIKEKLIELCVGAEICVYCEHNESTDIEHIYPKRLYPNRSFVWDNYVLACTKCNRDFKHDKFSIFFLAKTNNAKDISPKKNVYTNPQNMDALFMNQRKGIDPMDYLELDIINDQFVFVEKHVVGTREYKIAEFTKNTLGLNIRADLIEHRRNAAKHYKRELSKYVEVKNCINFNGLLQATDNDYGAINTALVFANERTRILDKIRKGIIGYYHPTVWRELIRQRAILNTINNLLNQAPEALLW